MRSLAQRFAFVMTAAATAPLLLLVVPNLAAGAYGNVPTALLVIGWSCIVVGAVGLASWLVSRSLLAPLMRFIESINPPGRATDALLPVESAVLPLEVRLARAALIGREAARLRAVGERSQYVATLIHDMKTPLIAIGRSIELAHHESDNEHGAAWLNLASEEIHRLLSIVQDVVDAERLSSGALSIAVSRVHVGAMVQRIVERLSPTRPHVTCRVSGLTSLMHTADPGLLERAIENVVANALHHAESRVVVELMPGLVRVADDGPGMPDADVAVPNVQVHRGDDGSGDGRRSSGLGVFIAKRILAAHGGRLVTESTGRTGTTLLLYLGHGERSVKADS